LYRKLAGLLLVAFDNFEGRCVYRCRKHLEKTQWMKKRDLKQLQLKRLKALLKHAYENVPYYHRSFKNENFHPADIKCLEDLRRVPILKKSAIRKESDKIMVKNIPKSKMESWSTSGTTAAPVRFCRSKEDISWSVGAELRGYSWAGYEVGDKLALIWRIHPEYIRSFTFKPKSFLNRTKILDVNHLSEKNMVSFAKKMSRFKPDFIRGYSSSVNIFATFMLQNNHFKIGPRAIFTTSQTLLPHYRKAIEEAFNCKVYDYYASNEVSHIAAQCGQHEGLHIHEENIIVEIVDNDEPVSPGEEGRVLLTNLHSYAMPFIRYDVGDLGKIFRETCSCGRELSLLKPIGRTYEYFVNRDGSFTYLRDLQIVFEDLPIKDFQVIQESYDEIIIKIVTRPGYSKTHTDFILKRIKLLGSAKIRVELVDSIPLEASGKIRHTVSKIATKYT
jgi:phenylacetate-CoA ligase